MDRKDRRLQRRIARRKKKVQRMIEDQKAHMDELDPSAFANRPDYLGVMSRVRRKLHRLEREMAALEDGRLPGPWT